MEEIKPQRAEIENWLRESAAFEAFLTLEDVSRDDPQAPERFARYYIGSWPSWQKFANAIADSLGWNQALTEFTAANAIPDGVLRWDPTALEPHLRDAYDIVESDGWCHVFER